MNLFGFLRRRREKPARPNWRTAQRMCAIIEALVKVEEDEHTLHEIARMANLSLHDTQVCLTWMEVLGLARSYFAEPANPDEPHPRMYSLTQRAYAWATQALLDSKVPDTNTTPQ